MNSHTSNRIKYPPGFREGLHQLDIAAHDVARKAGLPLTIITEPVVTTAQYFAIWQAYSDLIGDISIYIMIEFLKTTHFFIHEKAVTPLT